MKLFWEATMKRERIPHSGAQLFSVLVAKGSARVRLYHSKQQIWIDTHQAAAKKYNDNGDDHRGD
jgi:hypothetical protein